MYRILTAAVVMLGCLAEGRAQRVADDTVSAPAAVPQRIPLWNGRAPVGDGKVEEADAWITVHRPAKRNGAAIVICPGGGYGVLVTGAEGHGIATWLNRHGITGIVLEYRLPAGRTLVPLLDAQRALRTVRDRAKEWEIDPARVGIMGFSAGGHLAATAGTHFDDGDAAAENSLDRASCRPDFMILVYPVINMGETTHARCRANLLGKDPSPKLVELFSNEKQVTARTPPAFLAHAVDDKVVPPEHSKLFYNALQAQKVPSQYLELPSGGHGLNGYKGPMWDAWQEQSLAWLAQHKIIPPASEEESDSKTQQAFLRSHCFRCHGSEKQEGDFRADALQWPIADTDQAEQWQHVLDRLGAGEMPPAKEPKPAANDLADFLEQASTELRRASQQLTGGSNEVVLRRLNRIEYANTLRDLLGVEESLHTMLPEDPLSNGFDKIGSALTLSAEQIEAYLAAGSVALRSVIASAPEAPQTATRRFNYHENKQASLLAYPQVLGLDDKVVLLATVNTYTQVRDFRAPVAANYRFRVAASTWQSTKPLQLVVHAGAVVGRNDVSWRIGFAEVASEEPVVSEFQTRLRPGDSFYPRAFRLPRRPSRDELKENYQGPGLALHWVEVEGPLFETWPPRGHRVLFGDLPMEETPAPASASQRGRKSFAVVSQKPSADAERLLRAFLPRAFRRPITEDDLRPFRELALEEMDQHGASFQEAMLTAYQAVLCSPEFLFLRERSKQLNDYELASRLSYFLWSSMPDEDLLTLAAEGKLRDPAIRRQQVERMLASAKSREFTRNFCGQWLDLRKIDCTTPDRQLYPEFDEQLQEAMLQETELFFEEVLRNDLSLLNFVDSDWTILNRRLAEHYGLPEIQGLQLRKVALPPESPRGGLLTQASVLKVTANGTVTSPVVRGAWLLERMLGKPPAPPPPNVPALEPDTRGAVTIREQYAAHRQVQACAACHAKIDPHGFALENFDVIGGWRDAYRSLGKGTAVDRAVDGVRVAYRQGPLVDSADVLPDQRRFDDIKQYKRLLLEQREQIARNLCEKLMIYALGRGLALGDRPVVDGIVKRLRAENYGFRTLIHEIVASEPFVTK